MKKATVKKIRKWLIIAVIVYVVLGLALYFFQDKLLFRPEKLKPDHAFNFTIPYKEINLAINNERNLSIVQFTVPDSVRKGIVLYFHGNKRNIERYAPYATDFTKNNYEVWMMDYPGFGKTTGKRTEQIICDDALQLYKMARARVGKDSIVIYGKSFGTGVASQLASIRNCKWLVLETPYCSIDALFNRYAFIYPVSWMVKYHLSCNEYFKNIKDPITMFHGTDDGVIPYSQSEMLMEPWNEMPSLNRELVTIEKGAHNNLTEFPLYHKKLDAILK